MPSVTMFSLESNPVLYIKHALVFPKSINVFEFFPNIDHSMCKQVTRFLFNWDNGSRRSIWTTTRRQHTSVQWCTKEPGGTTVATSLI